jgi:hypothetical protein
LTRLLPVLLEFLRGVVAAGAQNLAAFADELVVVAEVAESAPSADRVEDVLVTGATSAHAVTACTLRGMTKKWITVAVAALAVLLTVVIVLLVVVIGQNSRAAEQEEHARIVAICERTHGSMDENLDAVIACIADLKE